MDDQLIAFITFSIISLFIGAVCHYFVRSYFLAASIATVFIVITIQIISYLQLGYLDPFYGIAMITSGAMAFIVSLIVGIPFSRSKSRKNI